MAILAIISGTSMCRGNADRSFPQGDIRQTPAHHSIRAMGRRILGRHCIKKKITFCYGHRLLDHEGKCKNLHGHNALIEIEVCADTLNPSGMVVDFADVKRIAKTWIDENLDHKMLLNKRDPVVPLLLEINEPLFLMDDNPTAENIAALIFHELRFLGLQPTCVTLWETLTGAASYKEG